MSESESMLEKVARAIRESVSNPPMAGAYGTHSEPDIFVHSARAAIEAMLEPTEAMTKAAHEGDFDIVWGYYIDGRPDRADDVYRVMLRKALEG